MRSGQIDQTDYVVLGISLIVTAVAGYLAYIKYSSKQSLLEKRSEASTALENQRNSLNKRRKRLENVSEELGWKSQFVQFTPSEDGSENQQDDPTGKLEGYPSIEELENNGRIVEQAREILKKEGYSENRIQEITGSETDSKEFLQKFYRKETRRSDSSLTSLQALANDLNLSLELVPVIQGTPVDAGTLGSNKDNQNKWAFKEPSPDLTQGGISEEGITVSELLNELNRIRNELNKSVQELKTQTNKTQDEYFSYVTDVGEEAQVSSLISESKNEISNLQQQVQDLSNDIQNKHEQLVKAKGQADNNLYAKKREKSQLLDRQTRELIQKKKELLKLKERLNRLRGSRQRERQPRKDAVDGQILSANQNASVAFIDVGRAEGLFTGQTFEVFNTVKGGREINKGQIKVQELFDNYARAEITSQSNPVNNPIESGDYIRSESFTRGQTKTFVFAGRFSGNNDRTLLKQMVLENGHNVKSEVTINTSFLVIGDGYQDQPAYERAQELSVEIISPSNLKRLFNTD